MVGEGVAIRVSARVRCSRGNVDGMCPSILGNAYMSMILSGSDSGVRPI